MRPDCFATAASSRIRKDDQLKTQILDSCGLVHPSEGPLEIAGFKFLMPPVHVNALSIIPEFP
jgi:hypothetical protein